jgi:AcrR family transcriptional regulator
MIIHSPMAAPAAKRAPVPDKREAILRAALALFAERTVGATAMPDVATRAGVAAGTIYRYFASKEELANAVFREAKLAMQRALAAHASAGSPREEFRGMWHGLWTFAQEAPAALRFLETHHHERYLDDASRALSESMTLAFSDFIRRAQAARVIRPGQPGVLIALAFGAFVGLVKEAEQQRITLDDRVVRAAGEAVWAMLAA